eukprot:2472308-Pleurochrysis_carterae.AAC.1
MWACRGPQLRVRSLASGCCESTADFLAAATLATVWRNGGGAEGPTGGKRNVGGRTGGRMCGKIGARIRWEIRGKVGGRAGRMLRSTTCATGAQAVSWRSMAWSSRCASGRDRPRAPPSRRTPWTGGARGALLNWPTTAAAVAGTVSALAAAVVAPASATASTAAATGGAADTAACGQ